MPTFLIYTINNTSVLHDNTIKVKDESKRRCHADAQ